jgi:hypothetical protein
VEVRMLVQERINAILADDRLNDESSDPTKAEAIEALIGGYGWEGVRECMMDILRDDSQPQHWRTAAHVFWGAVLDRQELPADEVIAWLWHRFCPEGQPQDDDIWGIVSKLKGVGYLSDYNPRHDPAVQRHLRAMRGQGVL